MKAVEFLVLIVMVSVCVVVSLTTTTTHFHKKRLSCNMVQTDASTTVINSLINKMIQMGSSLSDGQKQNRTKTAERTPIHLGFSLVHKLNINMNESVYALKYLGLPASEYSILDSGLVTRKANSKDEFTFSLSLADLTSNLNPTMQIPAILSTDIKVDTSVFSQGKIRMESSPLYLLAIEKQKAAVVPQHKDIPFEIQKDSSESTNEEQDFMFPRWMVVDSSRVLPGDSPQLPSPIQSTFNIELTWNPSLQRNKKVTPDNDCLSVKARVNMKFQAIVNVPSDVAAVINFPPMKVLVEQISKLTAKSIFSTVAPRMSELLVYDFERRKLEWSSTAASGTDENQIALHEQLTSGNVNV